MIDVLTGVRAILSSTPARWRALTDATPEELLRRDPSPGAWSALACLRHLHETEREVFAVRLEALLAGLDFPAFDPDAAGAVAEDGPARSLAGEFAERRAASLEILSRLSGRELGRTARHAELGVVTLGELLNEWAAHDLNHTVQAERALMQVFIAGSGPWRGYFADHDVAVPAVG